MYDLYAEGRFGHGAKPSADPLITPPISFPRPTFVFKAHWQIPSIGRRQSSELICAILPAIEIKNFKDLLLRGGIFNFNYKVAKNRPFVQRNNLRKLYAHQYASPLHKSGITPAKGFDFFCRLFYAWL